MVSEETELGAALGSERLGSEEGRAAVEDDSDEPVALERLWLGAFPAQAKSIIIAGINASFLIVLFLPMFFSIKMAEQMGVAN